jgi:hypothetical protein
MTRQIPWLRVFAEGAVIVVSILLAFGIDAWWDNRQERAAEQAALLGLATDLETSRDRLAHIIGVHEGHERRFQYLLAQDDDGVRSIAADSTGPYFQLFVGNLTFAPRRSTLDALVASGGLDIVSDAQLRAALVEWRTLADDLEEEASTLRSAAYSVRERVSELGALERIELIPAMARDEQTISRTRLKLTMARLYLGDLRDLEAQTQALLGLVEGSLR